MLTEQFIASVGPPTKPPGPGLPKDAAIFLHEFQPLSQQRQILKKSATSTNSLAVSPKHIFAAQADKGVVHVYNREKGNQEATVPFTEKISSITLACDDSVLILGTVEGRIFLWETCTGRQVTTASAHLQAVTVLAVDPTQNFLLSGSKDSTVNVWSIPSLLSFSRTADATPLRTFSVHRAEITSLVIGHSSSSCNFAVSASSDQTALVWDFRTGHVLRTYLLPRAPSCLDLDPADRAVYVGYDDGSLQLLDLLASPAGLLEAISNGRNAAEPIQPLPSTMWKLPDASHGEALSLGVSFDGSIVISGHQSGSIISWDVARRSFVSILTQTSLPGPVNNLQFLPVTGFRGQSDQKRLQINEIVKPKFGAFDSSDNGSIPGNYTLNVQFPSDLPADGPPSSFQLALTAPSFPQSLLDEGLSELASWGKAGTAHTNGDADQDFVSFDGSSTASGKQNLQQENESLKQQLASLRRVQQRSFEKMNKLNEERSALVRREQSRLAKKIGEEQNGVANGTDENDDSSD